MNGNENIIGKYFEDRNAEFQQLKQLVLDMKDEITILKTKIPSDKTLLFNKEIYKYYQISKTEWYYERKEHNLEPAAYRGKRLQLYNKEDVDKILLKKKPSH